QAGRHNLAPGGRRSDCLPILDPPSRNLIENLSPPLYLHFGITAESVPQQASAYLVWAHRLHQVSVATHFQHVAALEVAVGQNQALMYGITDRWIGRTANPL